MTNPPPKETPVPNSADPFKRDTPADTLRAVAAAFILGFDGLPPGGVFCYKGEGFVFSLRRTETTR